MKKEYLPCVEINPAADPRGVVIWLHGLGANGHDFEAVVPELELPASLPIRFVFPHAPQRPVTINGGMLMPAWFDIFELTTPAKVDHAGIEVSAEQTRALIQRERDAGIPSERIVLAGFSQGGVIVLHTALRYPDKLAGVMALSTYLPTLESLPTEQSTANLSIPIMMAHGTEDPLIPLARGRSVYEALSKMNYPVRWSEYRMPHSVCIEEISDIAVWLSDLFS
ncbi:MAG: alpha/beta fold hydrolase [SAR324 cluster bacterium]|nr:alpha/beta fold hydrolase [SAR324 cluster bacterium]